MDKKKAPNLSKRGLIIYGDDILSRMLLQYHLREGA